MRRRLAVAVERACPPWIADHSEDIVQVVLMRLSNSMTNRECPREFSTMYLFKAARGAAVDEIRRLYRRREVDSGEDWTVEQARSNDPDPERAALSRDIGRGIRDCLARLRDRRRLAVTLYLRGCTAAETARCMRWTVRVAENLVFRGLRDLRRCLAGRGLMP